MTAASASPTRASRSPRATQTAPVRNPPEAYACRRASRASSSATVAGTTPPSSRPVSAPINPHAKTAPALVERTGSGSSG